MLYIESYFIGHVIQMHVNNIEHFVLTFRMVILVSVQLKDTVKYCAIILVHQDSFELYGTMILVGNFRNLFGQLVKLDFVVINVYMSWFYFHWQTSSLLLFFK